MSIKRGNVLLGLVLLLLIISCKGPGGGLATRATSRGMSAFRKWIRYEVGQAKSFSYGTSQIREGVTIMGYEPSWLIYDSLYQNYQFQYLTDLVIGDYDINPITGFARYDSARIAYQVKPIIEWANYNNSTINVHASLTYYGDYGSPDLQKNFLTEAAKKNIIKTLDVTMDDFSERMRNDVRERVGVVLDFQHIHPTKWREYPKFIQRLKQALNKPEQDKSALIYVVAPLFPVENDWYSDTTVLKRVARFADKMIFRAHSFGKTPEKWGPMIPVYQDSAKGYLHSLDYALSEITDTIGLNEDQLVVEFPYYGLNWYDSTKLSNKNPMMPSSQMLLMAADTAMVYPDSAGAWFPMDDSLFVLEDTTSLDWKYKYLNERGVYGAGLYGLGYMTGYNPAYEDKLWEIIGNSFGERPPRLVFPGIAFFMSFFIIGFVYTVLYRWEVRFGLERKRRKFWYYILLISLMILSIIFCAYPLEVISMKWKLISICVVVLVPLGRKAAMLIFRIVAK